ncbi:MAG TPA: hypothetical protein DCS23_01640 [Candidatus Yonathbacteria bacterium]|nr:hypothetical protein [Candidatus Yonathbacteria bacterium]
MNNVSYSQSYYKESWANVLKKYTIYSPITDLGDLLRSKILENLLSKHRANSHKQQIIVHDYGPGNWLYLPVILKWATQKTQQTTKLIGFDFSRHAMEFGLKKCHVIPNKVTIVLKEGYIHTLVRDVPEQTVDIVISLETLEHLEKDEEIFMEFCRILNSEGLLIISVPNWKRPLFSVDWFTFKNMRILQEKDTHVGHLRRYVVDDFLEMARGKKVKPIEIVHYSFGLSTYFKKINNFFENISPIIAKYTFIFTWVLCLCENKIGNILQLSGSEGFFIVFRKI